MKDEQENKCTALVKYEPKPLSLRERLDFYVSNKRAEFEDALEKGRVRDPFSLGAAIILIGVSFAASAVARMFAPKPKPIRQGEMSGEVQGLMKSEQGILIPEIYGADPGDGKGGVKLPAIIIWASKLRKQTHVESTTTRGGKGFGGGSTTTETEVVEYDLDFAAMGGRGPLKLKQEWANADTLIDLDERGVYEGEDSSNTFTAPYQISDDTTASDGKEVTLQGSGGATSAVRFNAVVSNGAATRDTTVYYVNTGTFNVEFTVNGGTPFTVSFPNSSNARSSKVVPLALNNGNNTIKIRNTSTTLNLRIDRIFCFPGLTGEETTGIRDETADPDDDYSPTALPDASIDYDTSLERHNHVPAPDVYDVITGTTNLGSYAGFAVYEGNTVQLPDPVIEAAVGVGSTPAYRKRAFTRHSAFKLTRWGGVMPNISQLWENVLYKNCGQIYGQWCDRVGMLTTDYDHSGVTTAKVRGLLVSGRRYAPKDVMAETEEIYDTFFYEDEGKLYSKLLADAPQITIPESEIGWADDESEDLPSLNTSIANEIETDKRVTVKFIDPDREFEPNTQDEVRLITTGKREETVDVAITLTAAEARAVAAKRLYRSHTEATSFNFTLSWKYLYLHPGYIVNTTRSGISLSIQLTQIKGGISILECEGVAVENAILTQNVSTSGGGVFEKPPVAIPTMTVLTIMDLPVLRDADYAVNLGGGDYHAVAPRTSTAKAWKSATEFMEVDGEPKIIAQFTTPCVMGTVVGVVGTGAAQATTANFTTKETSYSIDVDLYGSDAALVNVTDTQAQNGTAGLCVFGNEAEGVTTWTKRPTNEGPNRWRGTGFFRGRRGTQGAVATHAVGERFVLINASVKFVPRNYIADKDVTRNYKAVTAGQSFDDAATVEYVWTALSMTSVTTAPASPAIAFDGTSLIHNVVAPPKYKELQISLVNDENTFTDPGNLVWKGKSTKWADSQLSTDPRSATRYFRILGPWDNPSPIVSTSYNVTAPAAPTITLLKRGVNTATFRITSSESAAKRMTFLKTVYQVASDSGHTTILAVKDAGKPYPLAYVDVTVSKPATVATIYLKAWFVDAFGPGSVGTY